jgi:ABC-type sulfate transport system permease component
MTRRRGRGAPRLVVLLGLVAVGFFALPLLGLLFQVEWGSLWGNLTSKPATDAIKLSLECSGWRPRMFALQRAVSLHTAVRSVRRSCAGDPPMGAAAGRGRRGVAMLVRALGVSRPWI